jgi:putative sigma-54 modulation protein
LNLTIKTNDVPLTPDLRSYGESRVSRLDRHFDRILDAHLQFDPESGRGPAGPTTVALRVHVSGGILNAAVTSTVLREAIDRVVDKMDQQLRRRKERLTEHGRPRAVRPRVT